MYLSRIALDVGRSEVLRLLASPNLLHGAVEGCFGGERRRNLWRVDDLDGQSYLMMLSEVPPDFEALAKRYGREDLSPAWAVKPYGALLDRLAVGQTWQFRLRANPVRSSAREREGERSRGKLYNHVTPGQQRSWLAARAEGHGFSLGEDAFDVVHSQWHKFQKGGADVSLLAVTFEGSLTISDPDRFRELLANGIGRGKAYGCGLMTIARAGRR